MVTFESGSMAPDLSWTTPTMLPVSNCAHAGSAIAQSNSVIVIDPICRLVRFNITFPLYVDSRAQASWPGDASRSFFLDSCNVFVNRFGFLAGSPVWKYGLRLVKVRAQVISYFQVLAQQGLGIFEILENRFACTLGIATCDQSENALVPAKIALEVFDQIQRTAPALGEGAIHHAQHGFHGDVLGRLRKFLM